jgi:hypothetical protein
VYVRVRASARACVREASASVVVCACALLKANKNLTVPQKPVWFIYTDMCIKQGTKLQVKIAIRT